MLVWHDFFFFCKWEYYWEVMQKSKTIWSYCIYVCVCMPGYPDTSRKTGRSIKHFPMYKHLHPKAKNYPISPAATPRDTHPWPHLAPTGSTTIMKIMLFPLDYADDNWGGIWILLFSWFLSSNCLSESGFMEVADPDSPFLIRNSTCVVFRVFRIILFSFFYPV